MLAAGIALWLSGCGGKAVRDRLTGDGSGGMTSSTTSHSSSSGTVPLSSSSSSSGTTSSAGGDGGLPSCSTLTQSYQQALQDATWCSACVAGVDPCDYTESLADPCGCPVPVNLANPTAVAAATAAFQQWVSAGCGPYACGQDCIVSYNPHCAPSDDGECNSICVP